MAKKDIGASVQYEGGVEPGEHGRVTEFTTDKEKRKQKKAEKVTEGGLNPGENGRVVSDES